MADTPRNGWEHEPLEQLIAVSHDDRWPPLGLACRWSELTAADLPPTVRSVLRRPGVTLPELERALLDETVLGEAARDLPDRILQQLASRVGHRAAGVSIRRLGLLDDVVPTLDVLGRAYDVTRERIRQVTVPREQILELAVVRDGWLAVCLRAWIDLHPREPLFEADVDSLLEAPRDRRALELVADALLPRVAHGAYGVWAGSERMARAVERLLETSDLVVGVRDWDEAAEVIAAELPGLAGVIDLDATLPRLGDTPVWDLGLDLSRRLAGGHRAHLARVARKIVTFLGTRACPIDPSELADIIERGDPPFEVFAGPRVDPEWLVGCVERAPGLLTLLEDGDVWLAPEVEDREPTGRIGLLRQLLVEHGEPIRMQVLCDRAEGEGMSRNQVGQLIHSRRAACLFMLRRGIVGLVGRDDEIDPAEYHPTTQRGREHVRPGHGMGVDAGGTLVADLTVRRSIREQGFALPWPFNLAVLDPDSTLLRAAGERLPVVVRPNGDLLLERFLPGTAVRVALQPDGTRRRLSIEIAPPGGLEPLYAEGAGQPYPVREPAIGHGPAWPETLVDAAAGASFERLSAVAAVLPDSLAGRRRLSAMHALLALGLLKRATGGWRLTGPVRLPAVLQVTLDELRADPGAYVIFDDQRRTATVWMVRAGWLTPNLGWDTIREVGTPQAREPDTEATEVAPARPAASAELQIAEAIELVLDSRRERDSVIALDRTVAFVRRCLVALGHTALGAVQISLEGDRATLTFDSASCLALPVGRTIHDGDRDHLRSLRGQRRFLTNGVRIERLDGDEETALDLHSPTDAERLQRLLRH